MKNNRITISNFMKYYNACLDYMYSNEIFMPFEMITINQFLYNEMQNEKSISFDDFQYEIITKFVDNLTNSSTDDFIDYLCELSKLNISLELEIFSDDECFEITIND